MLNWIGNAAGSIGQWLGDGIGNLFKWLFSGIQTIVMKILDASDGLFSVLDAIWGFAVGFVNNVLRLISAFFPFIPADVVIVISLGLFAIVAIGIYKKARGN